MQKQYGPVREALPTPREIRGRLIAIKKAEKQAAFERRLKCRSLIFGKGNGIVKNLTPIERKFCASVWRESYHAYLEEFRTGIKSRYLRAGKGWRAFHDTVRLKNAPRRTPMNERQHRRIWIASQKARWIRFDVPQAMKARVEEMRSAQ